MNKLQAVVPRRPYSAQPRVKVRYAVGTGSPYDRTGFGAEGCEVLDSRQDSATVDPLAGLIMATAGGDKAAFAKLYQESSGRLMAIALRMVGRRDLAEDILQEAYVAIWRKAGQPAFRCRRRRARRCRGIRGRRSEDGRSCGT